MSENWLPAVGDAVETPHGPGEILGFAAEAQDGAFRWGGARFADGPYVVLTYADNQVRGYPYSALYKQVTNRQVSLFERVVSERAVFVQQISSGKWAVWEESISALEGLPAIAPPEALMYKSREEALVAAHDFMRRVGGAEYGVREVGPLTPALALTGHIRRFLSEAERGATELPGPEEARTRVVSLLTEAVLLLTAIDSERR